MYMFVTFPPLLTFTLYLHQRLHLHYTYINMYITLTSTLHLHLHYINMNIYIRLFCFWTVCSGISCFLFQITTLKGSVCQPEGRRSQGCKKVKEILFLQMSLLAKYNTWTEIHTWSSQRAKNPNKEYSNFFLILWFHF